MSVLTNQVHLKIQFRHRFDQKCPFTDSFHSKKYWKNIDPILSEFWFWCGWIPLCFWLQVRMKIVVHTKSWVSRRDGRKPTVEAMLNLAHFLPFFHSSCSKKENVTTLGKILSFRFKNCLAGNCTYNCYYCTCFPIMASCRFGYFNPIFCIRLPAE